MYTCTTAYCRLTSKQISDLTISLSTLNNRHEEPSASPELDTLD